MRSLLKLLFVALVAIAPLPAAAKEGVRVSVTRGEGGDWIATYDFDSRAPLWMFLRSSPDLEGNSWRAQSWTIETPGARLERIGNFDVLASTDGAALRRVRIRMRPFLRTLSGDYSPVLGFSDGGLAFYTGHYQVARFTSRADIEKLPIDLARTPLALARGELRFVDEAHRLLVGGQAHAGRVAMPLSDNGVYVYTGNAAPIATDSFAGVVDAGLPGWVRAELDSFTPRLMQLYKSGLGAPSVERPMALIAWQGAEKGGSSLGGSVLEGMVVMQISGQQALEPNDPVLARIRWFIAHESAHFWIGQVVGYATRADAWITEGGAQFLSIRGTSALVPDYDATSALQSELNRCLDLTGPGEALATAEDRGEFQAYYACGAMLMLAAEAAQKRADPAANAFTFLRKLMDARRGEGRAGAADWLAQFAPIAGDPALVEDVREFLEKGSTDPRAFWKRLFERTGVAVEDTDAGLRLAG